MSDPEKNTVLKFPKNQYSSTNPKALSAVALRATTREARKLEALTEKLKKTAKKTKFAEDLAIFVSQPEVMAAVVKSAGEGNTACSQVFDFDVYLKAVPLNAYENVARTVLREYFPGCQFDLTWSVDQKGNPRLALCIRWG
jgi:hypothetical protein